MRDQIIRLAELAAELEDTVFARLTVGARRYWIQRWDVGRARGKSRLLSRDGLIGWTWGNR